MEKHLLNVREVADYLGFSTGTIRKWVRRGVIPCSKVNGDTCFDRQQINQWLEKEMVAGNAQVNFD